MATEKTPIPIHEPERPERDRDEEQLVPEEHAPARPRHRAAEASQPLVAAQTVVAVAVVLTVCYFAKLVLVVLLVSVLLAFILAPLVRVQELIRIPRPLAAFIALLVVAGILYGLSYFGYSKAQNFAQELPHYSARIKRVVRDVKDRIERIQKSTQLPGEGNKNTVNVQQQANWTDVITSGLGTVTEILFTVSFIPFLVYFMLSWQDHVRAATVMLFRMENRNTAYVTLGRISQMIHAFINGNLLVGLVASIISVIVFGALHLPYFYFLGFISGFLTLIPYLGVVFAIIPPVTAGLGQLHGMGFLAIIVTVFGVHLFTLNVLYPKFIGRQLQLNPLAVTLALLIWGWLWGAMGLILAIPITGAMKIIFDNVESLRPYGAWLGE
jgi:predicted PurR-regulated permease PerM